MSCSSPTIVFVDDLEFSAVKTVQLRIVDDVSVELAPADPEEDPTPIQYLEYLPAAVSRCTADNPCQVANVFTWGAHVILGVVEEASLGGCDLFADGGIVERIAIPAIRELDFIRERCCKTCCDEQCVELDDVLKDMRDHFCSEQLVRDCTGVVDLDNLPPSVSFLPSYPYTEESSYCYISAADVFEDPSPNLQQQQQQHYPTHSDDDDDDVTGYYSSRCDISDISDDNDSIFDYAYDDGIDYSSSGSSSGNSSGSTGSSANPFYKQAGSITYQPSLDADLACDARLFPTTEPTERFDDKDSRSSSSSNGKQQFTSDEKDKGGGFGVQSVSPAGSNAGSKVSPPGVDYVPAMLAVTLITVRRRFGKSTARLRRSRNLSNRRAEVRRTRSRVRVGKPRIAAGIG